MHRDDSSAEHSEPGESPFQARGLESLELQLQECSGDSRKQWLVIAANLDRRWGQAVVSASPARKPQPTAGDFPKFPIVEDYLVRFPQLGTVSDVPVEVITREYHVRMQHGEWLVAEVRTKAQADRIWVVPDYLYAA